MRFLSAVFSTSLLFQISLLAVAESPGGNEAKELRTSSAVDKYISSDILEIALKGYHHTDSIRSKNILTIIDYSKPSSEERFFVIDVQNRKLLYHCLVAHGKNSGDKYAVHFSNVNESLKSSLGFFLTAETYYGKHGFGLRLDGLEKGINDNARRREIVIHGADYVSDLFVKKYGRLGLSWGCPALPVELTTDIIKSIANGSCIFIYARDSAYLSRSKFIKAQ
jgi:hypothetical protein